MTAAIPVTVRIGDTEVAAMAIPKRSSSGKVNLNVTAKVESPLIPASHGQRYFQLSLNATVPHSEGLDPDSIG